jgi:Ser/Thr protein kinase RdoA (MazF antagonist)
MCSAGEQAPMYAAQGDKHMPVQFDQRMQIFNEFKDLRAHWQLIQKQLSDCQMVIIHNDFTDQ